MKSIRPLVLALALGIAAPLALAPLDAAIAADAAEEGPGIASILPVPWGVADGESKIRVQVVVLSESGLPMSGLSLKASASAGETSGWTEVGPGLYRFSYTPPKSDAALQVPLTVEGKAGKGTVKATYTVHLSRMPDSDLAGSTTPDKVVLGQNKEATLSITGGPPKGSLLVASTSGEVTNLTNMGGGKFTARYEAPAKNFPQLGIVTLANAANPIEEFGYVVIPLAGAVEYPVEAPAGSTVILKIKGQEYGPVKATAEGKASVPVIVPPGVDKATQVTVVDGESSEKQIDLRVPETLRIKAIPAPKAVPADSSIGVPIRVVAMAPTGEPDKDAKISARAEGGTISAFAHTKKGIYLATFTPADSDALGQAKITVGIEGNDKQTDELSFELMPRRATELMVTTDPKEVSAATEGITVVAVATGANGKKVPGQVVSMDVVGGTTRGVISDGGDGTYEAGVKRDGDVTRIGLVVTGTPSTNPVAHVVVLPARTRLEADGASAMDVVVVSVDAFGYPVAGVEVELSAEGASLPGKVTTNAHGFARVELTAGQSETLVSIEAKAGPAHGASAVLQGGKRKAVKDLPVGISGSKAVREMYASWEGAAVNLSLKADPNAAPPMPVVKIGSPDAATAVLDVTFFPNEVRPGGKVTVRTIPMDAEGNAIPGKTLDVLTSSGSLAPTKETGGIYETVLTIAKDGTGEAKVSVVSPSGVMKLVKIPINPDAVVPGAAEDDDEPTVAYVDGGSDDGAADAATEPEETPPEKEPKEPKEPKDPSAAGDHAWLRARVSGVGEIYRYAQTPSDDPGPLIPAPLTVGDGSSPATPFGFEASGRAWVPDIPYIGGLVNAQATWYAIASPAFDGDAPDWLYDVDVMALGRYPFDVGADQFWVGGKAGFHYDDFMIFTGCLEPNCTVNFDPVGMPGLGLGVEAGAEIDAANLYFIGGYTHALANFSVPYMNSIDANVGMAVVEHVDLDLGFSWISRNVALQGTESGNHRGELSDSQLAFKFGVGFEL